MSKKDNFNRAMFEMFGVGKGDGPTEEEIFEKVAEYAGKETESGYESSAEGTNGAAHEFDEMFESEAAVYGDTALLDASVDGRSSRDLPVTYIAPGTVVEGNLRSQGDLDVAGDVIGDIISEGSVIVRKSINGNVTAENLNIIGCHLIGDIRVGRHLYLNEESVIDGDVEAEDLTSSGRINGNLSIAGNITLDGTARIYGDVRVGTLTMARGAIIRGMLDMVEK